MFPDVFVKLNEGLEKVHLSTYDIFLAFGIILMLLYIVRILEKKESYTRKRTNRILITLGISLAIAYLSAWFFDGFFHYLKDGRFEGGVTFISGMLGGVACFAVLTHYFNRSERGNVLNLLNLIIPGVILAHAIGRIGCFSQGCCYGKETSSIFGVVFPKGTMAYAEGHRNPLHPTQLYEAFFLSIIFFVLKISYLKKNAFGFYLILYGFFRSILEIFLRGDNRGILFGLPPSFVLSIVLILLGSYLVLKSQRKRLKE
jgi:phosphatidylglycerol:prolipoprotein diacylglycerol transferase